MRKSNTAQIEQRVTEVYHRLLLGDRRVEILQYAAKNEWDVAPRTVDDYIRRANHLFEQHAEVVRERELGKAIERLNYLFMKLADGVKDYKSALAVQKELNALLGLNAPTRHQVDDWRDQALQDLRDGKFTVEALAEAFGGRDGLIEAFGGDPRATQLFAATGLPVSVAAGAGKRGG